MENKIVTDFERLRVFSASNLGMDDLVNDLGAALEEAASHKRAKSDGGVGTSNTRRNPRKRRGRRRRMQTETGNMSEASQSSLDEVIKDYMESVVQHSDSDDLAVAQRIVRLAMPLSGNFVPTQVESDSVNENMFSPVRPQRRRKKYKTMAIDPDPGSSQSPIQMPKPRYHRHACETVPLPHCSMGTSPMDGAGYLHQGKEGSVDDAMSGKRKRSNRLRSDCNGTEFGRPDEGMKDEDTMEVNSQEGSSSSSTISSSSETESFSNDEIQEADDEQSDFFYEPGETTGIPGVIPWWENERVTSGDESVVSEKQFQQILTGSFEHLPKSSQIAFKAKMTKIMKHCGREIRFGRRKLKGKIPGYTVSRFIQERHSWKTIQGRLAMLHNTNNNSPTSNHLIDSKRQRKTPPPIPGTPLDGDPIPESNIGNKMLQSMGWHPGTGLGTDGSGIRSPISAHVRPRRQGLGSGSPHLSNRLKTLLRDNSNTKVASSTPQETAGSSMADL